MPSQVAIGECTDRCLTWTPEQNNPHGKFTYIDIASIDRDAKRICSPAVMAYAEAPSRARQLVKSGDILVSTVRPNLNGVALVPAELDGAIASTGYTVLRPRQDKVEGRYLFHWVKSKKFVDEMTRLATGASYPAVSDKIVRESRIPLPSLPEQRRIAAILDTADALRAKRREAIANLDKLLQSVFMDMFGDPVTNPKNWPVGKLSELGSLDRGVSKHRPRNAPELLDGLHPLIQTGDVARSGGYIREFQSTYSDFGLAQSKKWPEGTLCITIAANIANTGILTFDACFPDSVVGFTPGPNSNVEFVQTLLGFLKLILEERAPQVAQKNINLAILRELPVPIPPASLQSKWATIACKIEQLKSVMRRADLNVAKLMASIQSSAFDGTL